jgi:cytochrome c oxidase assembly factor CtaG
MVFSVEAAIGVPLLALAYATIARRKRPSNARMLAAAVAFALIAAAFTTPLQTYALHTFLWAHLLQNVVLAEWAPGLLVLAVPPLLGARLAATRVFRPLVVLPVWIATYMLWHLPWIYDTALEHRHSLLLLEHLMYLIAGIGVWWPVIHGRYSPGAKAAYLFAAFVLASPIGLLLALVGRPVYDFYADAPRTWGPDPLFDQQLAGMTMAFEQAVVFFGVFVLYFFRFVREEQREPHLYDGLGSREASRAE